MKVFSAFSVNRPAPICGDSSLIAAESTRRTASIGGFEGEARPGVVECCASAWLAATGRLCDARCVSLREANISRIRSNLFDVLVVGAGINGAVSAASLAGRGVSVALIDRGDFGSFTSQESSNLVWGGFKYLENYELPLVLGLCRSRNRLMKAYPDNVKEIGFLAALDESAPYTPRFAGLGALAYWGIGLFGTRRPHVF